MDFQIIVIPVPYHNKSPKFGQNMVDYALPKLSLNSFFLNVQNSLLMLIGHVSCTHKVEPNVWDKGELNSIQYGLLDHILQLGS